MLEFTQSIVFHFSRAQVFNQVTEFEIVSIQSTATIMTSTLKCLSVGLSQLIFSPGAFASLPDPLTLMLQYITKAVEQ